MADRRVTWRWWGIGLRGVAAIVLGILSMLLPVVALTSLVVLFSIFALCDGALTLSIVGRVEKPQRAFVIIHGIASLAIGFLALSRPGMTVVALLMLIAVWAVITGIMSIIAASRLPHVFARHWGTALSGILSVVFGVILMVSPKAGAVMLGVWVGLFALAYGIVLLATAIQHRHDGAALGAAA